MEVVRRQGTTRQAQQASRARAAILSMYQEPPTEELTLTEFEQLAMDRLNGKAVLSEMLAMRTVPRD